MKFYQDWNLSSCTAPNIIQEQKKRRDLSQKTRQENGVKVEVIKAASQTQLISELLERHLIAQTNTKGNSYSRKSTTSEERRRSLNWHDTIKRNQNLRRWKHTKNPKISILPLSPGIWLSTPMKAADWLALKSKCLAHHNLWSTSPWCTENAGVRHSHHRK